jgi:hypothetical protein
LARIGRAFVDVRLAEGARITRKTSTREGVQAVNTSRTILARIGRAFIDVRLAERTRVAREAGAREGV